MTERQIAWTILRRGHDIQASDGSKLGTVKEVVADEGKDIFSGLTFSPGLTRDDLFIPADLVTEITEDAVHVSVSEAEAEELQPYEG